MDDDSKRMTSETIVKLRTLAHDLSNSIENVMQASYMMAQSQLDEPNQKWLNVVNSAAREAAEINRQIREILRSQS
jgi:signal transduction histidine kinase